MSKHIISSSQKGRESEIRDNFETIGSVHTNKTEKKQQRKLESWLAIFPSTDNRIHQVN